MKRQASATSDALVEPLMKRPCLINSREGQILISARSLEGQLQAALVVFKAKQKYELISSQPVPTHLAPDEVLVRTLCVGLNPIDWKAPLYGFGIPQYPHISGRELVGEVVLESRDDDRLKLGDKVIVVSTDYRDQRKAAFQRYVVAKSHNAARLPHDVARSCGAAMGVAFVTAAMVLGICLGLDFTVAKGPDLLEILRATDKSSIATDIQGECEASLEHQQRSRPKQWLLIWGGSSTCALMINQLARILGLRTILVLDQAKHGSKIAKVHSFRADAVVDINDAARARDVIRGITENQLCLAVDAVDSKSSERAANCLAEVMPGTAPDDALRCHLVGLNGTPKTPRAGVQYHKIPLKLFHEVAPIGEAIVLWMEHLLATKAVCCPRIIDVVDGLQSINTALDRMQRGEISGGKLVAEVK